MRAFAVWCSYGAVEGFAKLPTGWKGIRSHCYGSATKTERYYVDTLLKLHVRLFDDDDGIFDATIRYRAKGRKILEQWAALG